MEWASLKQDMFSEMILLVLMLGHHNRAEHLPILWFSSSYKMIISGLGKSEILQTNFNSYIKIDVCSLLAIQILPI